MAISNKVEFGFAESPFGSIIVARTWDGVCDLQFLDYNRLETIHELAMRWGEYTPTTQSDTMAQTVRRFGPPRAARRERHGVSVESMERAS